MNTEIILILFRLAGLAMLGLVLVNFIAAKRLSYAQSLSQADVIVRQIFYVHCGYIVFLITGLAALCLGRPNLLLNGPLARMVCVFFAIFWGSRVVVQLAYYDAELRKKERFWDVFFLMVFLVLAVIFTVGGIMGQ